MENLEDDEKTKTIKSAVKLIRNSAAMVNLESSMYSLVNDMVNLDHQSSREFCLDTLQNLINVLSFEGGAS